MYDAVHRQQLNLIEQEIQIAEVPDPNYVNPFLEVAIRKVQVIHYPTTMTSLTPLREKLLIIIMHICWV